MQRFDITTPDCDLRIEPDQNGEWVRYSDIESLINVSASIAERHDRFLKALRSIAAMPQSIASVATGVAKDAIQNGK